MYAKVFSQIFDSSIAENYRVRHVFEDLLKLCDRKGVVDMTIEAVARRTNVPIEEVRAGIDELMRPDAKSRSRDNDGRRLVPIDPERGWGWVIVSYERYRSIQDSEMLRDNWRRYQAKRRQTMRAEVNDQVSKDAITKVGEKHLKRFRGMPEPEGAV